MTDVEIEPAAPADEPVLQNLMQLYVHDFSEHWAGTANGDLGRDGRFAAYPLDAYWRERDRVPLLIKVDGRLAGFALLNAVSHAGLPVDRNMAEFFIVRKHRRGGVGTRAAREIFTRYPGRWEAAVARRNTVALAFWRKAVRTHPRATGIEERDLATNEWNGPILRFEIAR